MKKITQSSDSVNFYGGKSQCLKYDRKGNCYIIHYKNKYLLEEFMVTPKGSWLKDFDGYLSDSFFSGVAIKFDPDDNDRVKVYSFIS